jgi:hypothetical protein
VPGIYKLLPKELSDPKRSGPEEAIPVAKSALPDFGAPAHLMPNDFWSNLKQFVRFRPGRKSEVFYVRAEGSQRTR